MNYGDVVRYYVKINQKLKKKKKNYKNIYIHLVKYVQKKIVWQLVHVISVLFHDIFFILIRANYLQQVYHNSFSVKKSHSKIPLSNESWDLELKNKKK